MAAGDIYELSVDGLLADSNITNVHHFKQVGSDGAGDARDSVIDMYDTKLKAAMLNCLSDDYDMTQYRCRRIQPTQTQTITTIQAGAGTMIFKSLPTQSCAILREYATPDARKGTGHIKLSGISANEVNAGRISLVLEIVMNILGALLSANQTDSGAGFTWRTVVYSVIDTVGREVMQSKATGKLKTVYSRQLDVGQ